MEADRLRAVEFFYGVGLVGRSTVACFSPLIKGHDIGDTGMSPPVQAKNLEEHANQVKVQA